jgi:uncharacterized protein (DUF1015 family)
MATIKPFAALRPLADEAAQICELPYDVMSSEEARAMAAGKPLSFLHVSKPEIDLDPKLDVHDERVYARGLENFRRLISERHLIQDAQPGFYLYRQIMGAHTQVGLVAVASCEEYLQNIIKKHELTRPDKEDDRVRHIEMLESQTGPVFLTYPAHPAVDRLVQGQTEETPALDFTASDGVRHTSWVISQPEPMRDLASAFAKIPCLYIADGHHRSAAAARIYRSRQGRGQSGFFLSVIFPHNQVQILPYNRALKDLNGLTPALLLEKLAAVFTRSTPGSAQPAQTHELGFYLDGQWHTLKFREALLTSSDPQERLDVSLLQQHVLTPLFGIDDPRTNQRIQFVGGIRGTTELEKLVNTGQAACAFSMFPTSIEDLMAIADGGGLMPPKSTWFEPKLRDGMFCHLL